MKKVVAWLFQSLDGIVESPHEWVMFDEEMGPIVTAYTDQADTMLLGRRTYQLFAASWPQRTNAEEPIADWMNQTPKYVVSATLTDPAWSNTTVIAEDVVAEIERLKKGTGGNILINGSATLVESMLAAGVVDELDLFVVPTVVGAGKRLFDSGAKIALDLVSSRSFANGVVELSYAPAADRCADDGATPRVG